MNFVIRTIRDILLGALWMVHVAWVGGRGAARYAYKILDG